MRSARPARPAQSVPATWLCGVSNLAASLSDRAGTSARIRVMFIFLSCSGWRASCYCLFRDFGLAEIHQTDAQVHSVLSVYANLHKQPCNPRFSQVYNLYCKAMQMTRFQFCPARTTFRLTRF